MTTHHQPRPPEIWDGSWGIKAIKPSGSSSDVGKLYAWKGANTEATQVEVWSATDFANLADQANILQIGPTQLTTEEFVAETIYNLESRSIATTGGTHYWTAQHAKKTVVNVTTPATHGNPAGFPTAAVWAHGKVHSGGSTWTDTNTKLRGRLWRFQVVNGTAPTTLTYYVDYWLLRPDYEPPVNGTKAVFVEMVPSGGAWPSPGDYIAAANVSGNWIVQKTAFLWRPWDASLSPL